MPHIINIVSNLAIRGYILRISTNKYMIAKFIMMLITTTIANLEDCHKYLLDLFLKVRNLFRIKFVEPLKKTDKHNAYI